MMLLECSMSDLKKKIIEEIMKAEGGYVDDPNDSGGETNYGITEAVARANGFSGDMHSLPPEVAFNIYSSKYWDSVCADDLLAVSEALASEVVDTAVNMGPGRAGKFLQRCLNSLNNRADLYGEVVVDGDIGPGTVAAVRCYAAARDVSVMVKALNCLQGAFYIELAERREKDESFVYGWLRARVNL